MKTRFFLLTKMVIVLVIWFVLISCPVTTDGSSGGGGSDIVVEDGTPADPVNWTIMVYLDGDNNLEAAGIEDINEMEAVNLSGYSINVIVLFDRISGYDTSNGNWTNTRLYKIDYDSSGVNTTIISERLGSVGLGLTTTGNEELNMGNPTTLSNFINYCKKMFPASNYSLILWNHGGGWRKKSTSNKIKFDGDSLPIKTSKSNLEEENILKGVCWDDTNGSDNLYMKEVSTAVSGKGLNVIGFDACLMGMLEVAYEIRNHADYMIGSEELEPGDGWEYNYWLNTFRSSGQTAVNLCNSIIDAYQTRYSSTPNTTLSAINLSEINNVFTSLNNFSTALYNQLTTDSVRDTVLADIYYNVQNYWPGNGSDYNLDLWHLADLIQDNYSYCDTQCINLKSAINNAVIDEWHHSGSVPDSHGTAIHFISTTSGGSLTMLYAYCNGYSTSYPVAFVTSSSNTWIAHYSGGSIVGPGLLYRLWFEPLP